MEWNISTVEWESNIALQWAMSSFDTLPLAMFSFHIGRYYYGASSQGGGFRGNWNPPRSIYGLYLWPSGSVSVSILMLSYFYSLFALCRPENYDLLENNCNSFSNEVAQFLTGKTIPDYIVNLPAEVLSTWVHSIRSTKSVLTVNTLLVLHITTYNLCPLFGECLLYIAVIVWLEQVNLWTMASKWAEPCVLRTSLEVHQLKCL